MPTDRKRRRLSEDYITDSDLSHQAIPRLYSISPKLSRTPEQVASPKSSTRRAGAFSTNESWTSSTKTSPYNPGQRSSGVRSPPPFDTTADRSDWRPTLPSLPSLTLERGTDRALLVQRDRSEYALEVSRSGAQTYPQASSSFDTPPIAYQPPAVSYGHRKPRWQSYPGPSSLSQDRSPFSASHHSPVCPKHIHPYGMDINNGSGGKRRKRRGNLPKETTDKLRAWFVAHLQHPYPTEDEKQELVRRTGLQMSKYLFDYESCNAELIVLSRSNFKLVHQRAATSTSVDDQQCQGRVRCKDISIERAS